MPTNDAISDLVFARQMVAKYRDMLAKSAGLKSITIDGQMVTYAEIEANYRKWQKSVARLSGSRPLAVTIDMENAQ
jgi:hypothetical protein